MTPSLIAALAGVVISLVASYVPRFSAWFAAQTSQTKALIMLAANALAALLIFGFGCLGWGDLVGGSVTCDQSGAMELLKLFAGSILAGQATYLLTPTPPAKIAAMQAAK
jgi:hypothetical protein